MGSRAVTAIEARTVAIGSLVPDPDNARTHPKENIEAITKSLRRFGQVEPIVVQKKTNVVIGGNGRLEAMVAMNAEAEKSGAAPPWQKVRAAFVDVTEDERKALGVALNRTGDMAGWDNERLARLVLEIQASEDRALVEALSLSQKELDAIAGTLPDDLPDDVDGATEITEDIGGQDSRCPRCGFVF